VQKKLFLLALAFIVLIGLGLYLRQQVQAKEPQILNEFAMDTHFRAILPANISAGEKAEVVDKLHHLESLLNRFIPDSDIGKINLSAPVAVEVDQLTWQIAKEAIGLAAKTGGKFDPTIGPLVDLWGLTTNGGVLEEPERGTYEWEPPTQDEIIRILSLINYGLVELLENPYRIRLSEPGMVLDFGGIAKGFALDLIVLQVKQQGHHYALIDFGGDIMAYGKHPSGRPWKLGVRHPRRSEEMIAILEVYNKAVVTSGDYQRYRLYDGRRYSHLIDPDLGRPAQELSSVTILAPTGVIADALSTAVFVMGKEKGKATIESWPGVEGVIVDAAMEVWYSKGLEGNIAFP